MSSLNIEIPLLTILRTPATARRGLLRVSPWLMAATYARPRKATQMEARKRRAVGEHSTRTGLVNRTRAEKTPRSPEDEHNGAVVSRARDLAGKRS